MKIKCISLHEPWASAVALGLKTIETRSWETKYRGTLGIHAAKKWTADQKAKLFSLVTRFPEFRVAWTQCCFGNVVALVDIIDCEPAHHIGPLTDLDRALGDFSRGRWGWILTNIRPLTKLIPVIGRQGFFNVEIDMIEQDGGVF